MTQVTVIQDGGDFYVTEAGREEFRVSYPHDVAAHDVMAAHRAFGWFDRVCQACGWEATFEGP